MKDYIYVYTEEELNILSARLKLLKKRYTFAVIVFCCVAVFILCMNFILGHILPLIAGILVSVLFVLWSVYYFDVVYGKCKKYYKYIDSMTGTDEIRTVARFIKEGESVKINGFSYRSYVFYDKVKEKEETYIAHEKVQISLEYDKTYYLIVANRYLIAFREAEE